MMFNFQINKQTNNNKKMMLKKQKREKINKRR